MPNHSDVASAEIAPSVAAVFATYPPEIQVKLFHLRELIYQVAGELNVLHSFEETLKWGEPSYLCKGGSTIRIAWKNASPDHYFIYFNCKSRLVDAIKEVYQGVFQTEGNRALVIHKAKTPPEQALKHCFALALSYHSRKHLPLLGV